MQIKRHTVAQTTVFRDIRLEIGKQEERAKAEATGGGPDLACLRPPRRTCFADGRVVTLQHWLDLNA